MSIISSGDVPEAEKLLGNQDMRVNCLDEVSYILCVFILVFIYLFGIHIQIIFLIGTQLTLFAPLISRVS